MPCVSSCQPLAGLARRCSTLSASTHAPAAVQDWIHRVAHIPVDGKEGTPDVCVIELGGTVGDIESMPFIEALRQFQFRVGAGNFCSVHVSLVPVLGAVGEQKTKPTQHSVAVLRSLGINPHLLACRSAEPLQQSVRDKLVSGARQTQLVPSGILCCYVSQAASVASKDHTLSFWDGHLAASCMAASQPTSGRICNQHGGWVAPLHHLVMMAAETAA